MNEVILAETQFCSSEAVHDYLAGELAFPAYYGKNLAALSDCLGDISTPTFITIIRSREDDFDVSLDGNDAAEPNEGDLADVEFSDYVDDSIAVESDEETLPAPEDPDGSEQIDWDDFTKICRVFMRSARSNPSLHVMIVC